MYYTWMTKMNVAVYAQFMHVGHRNRSNKEINYTQGYKKRGRNWNAFVLSLPGLAQSAQYPYPNIFRQLDALGKNFYPNDVDAFYLLKRFAIAMFLWSLGVV